MNIVSNQAGWVVRGQDAGDGFVFILNASNDTAGTPNTLQELDLHGGSYTSVGSVALGTSLAPGSWHMVSTTVSGTSITVSLDNQQIASLSSSSFPSGTSAFSSGTVGFREYSGEEADFRTLGAGSSFTEKSLTAGTPCTNAVFGDPDCGSSRDASWSPPADH